MVNDFEKAIPTPDGTGYSCPICGGCFWPTKAIKAAVDIECPHCGNDLTIEAREILVFGCYPGQEEQYLSMLRDYDREHAIRLFARSSEDEPGTIEYRRKYGEPVASMHLYMQNVGGLDDKELMDAWNEFSSMCSGYSRCLHDLKLEPYFKK